MSRLTALALEYVRDELGREHHLRTSLEGRANALISAYIGSVAAAIALAALVETDSPISEGTPLIALLVGGGLVVVGLMALLVAIVPVDVGAVDEDDIRALAESAKAEPDTADAVTAREAELTELLADEVIALRGATKLKARALVAGTVAFVAAAAVFAVGLSIAL